MTPCHLAFVVLAVILRSSTAASAQPPPTTAPDTTTAAAPGPTVFVTLRNGGPALEGSLLQISANSVAILTADGPRTVPLERGEAVQRAGDRSHDGAIKGALVLGVWCALVCGQAATSRNPYGRIVMGNAAWGALFGWLFDLGHTGRTTVYPVKPARPSEP